MYLNVKQNNIINMNTYVNFVSSMYVWLVLKMYPLKLEVIRSILENIIIILKYIHF